MSAWIVTKAHIDVLVHALGVRELFPDDMTPDEVGRLLWQENHNSVNYRYDETEPCPEYVYTAPPSEWDLNEVMTEVSCYEYQTCEHPGWNPSVAHLLMTQLRRALLAAGASHDESRDRGTPWGVPDCGGKHHSHEECHDCYLIGYGEEAKA
jgi:hypothetical protein